ncbi:DUF4173 domain-containing protein [Pacificoceanicola onchidii]|uniref:DUF4153 domain-containing protein n=1 Tax=Pacificoceanicola onchidii TaxID=2562685 RepID=UPI0010A59533|nr:DUF4173 domain-containing protein [Pacificoceanicola onchidii]
MDSLTLRGVPRALARDGWWLMSEEGAGVPDGAAPAQASGKSLLERLPQRLLLVLLALVLLADLLFWERDAGLSLALYAWAVLAGFLGLDKARRDWKLPVLICAMGSLPVIAHVQFLSVLFLMAGLLTALALLRWPEGTAPGAVGGQALRLFLSLFGAPFAPLVAGLKAVARAGQSEAGLLPKPEAGVMRAALRNWAMPVGGGLILLSLMVEANPVLELRLTQITTFDVSGDLIGRAVFWTGLGLLLWPLLTASPATLSMPKVPAGSAGLGVNAGSVLRALWVFNGILGVQTLMDLTIFVGGAGLPDGMSYAEYAHRGAYPLVATAMLAGVFALMARPFAHENSALMPLLMLWLAQNVALCASSALRLELYVEAYGLTYLRLHAFVWMALVAAGLGLIGWQIMGQRDNGWLSLRLLGLGLMTVYAACFINFAEIVAEQQLSRPVASVEELDISYVCNLGPMANDALTKAMEGNEDIARAVSYRHCRAEYAPAWDGWWDWTFRAWRVAR